MFRFSGDFCQYCKHELTENDDIVVCPECGAPYHRDCYKLSGECVRADLHASGQAYFNPNKTQTESVKEENEIRCPRCGEMNKESARFCKNCGMPFTQSGNMREFIFTNDYRYDDSEEIEDGVTNGDVAKYLGQNAGYFITKYKAMKSRNKPISTNFSALFFNYMYLFYRKSYVFGIIFALVLLLLRMPSTFVTLSEMIDTATYPQFAFLTTAFVEKMSTLSVFADLSAWLIEIGMCLFFNWFYMKSVIKKVKEMKNIYGNDFPEVAQKSGGVLGRRVILIFFAIYFGIVILSQFSLLFL